MAAKLPNPTPNTAKLEKRIDTLAFENKRLKRELRASENQREEMSKEIGEMRAVNARLLTDRHDLTNQLRAKKRNPFAADVPSLDPPRGDFR